MSIEVEEYYKKQAKELVNMMYDNKIIDNSLTRETIDWLENYIGAVFQSKIDMAIKCTRLTDRLERR